MVRAYFDLALRKGTGSVVYLVPLETLEFLFDRVDKETKRKSHGFPSVAVVRF